ncbi:MAG: putative toxin-antitoxin system toxin component, PIN family [Actinobacteria bacterium]|nr:putative toxin-antitoxin system toxin component, PIN family [Actinomycetota bacterium]
MIRAVLDSNTHVSAAIIPYGPSAKLIVAWHENKFTLITCQTILREVEEVMRRPHIIKKYKGITEENIETLVKHIEEFAIVTPGKLNVEVISADHKDDHVLACAIEGEADYIVTGDSHLQNLKVYNGIKIVRPVEFLEIL